MRGGKAFNSCLKTVSLLVRYVYAKISVFVHSDGLVPVETKGCQMLSGVTLTQTMVDRTKNHVNAFHFIFIFSKHLNEKIG
jgi:hypothetical protein